jgi:hypothetical protein
MKLAAPNRTVVAPQRVYDTPSWGYSRTLAYEAAQSPSSARVHRAIKKRYLSASLAFAETVFAFPFNSFGGLPKRRR